MDGETNEERQEDELKFLQEVYGAVDLRDNDPWKVSRIQQACTWGPLSNLAKLMVAVICEVNYSLLLQVKRPPEYQILIYPPDEVNPQHSTSFTLKVKYPINYPDEYVNHIIYLYNN